jgi:pimeloyl-ACP methyl ester carboxylesterase
MPKEINLDRSRFIGTAAMTIAVAQLGTFASAEAQSSGATPANATTTLTPSPGTHTSFASMKQIKAGLLNVGYAEDGPANGPVVILLHGWPYDIHAYVDVAPLLASAGYRVIVPFLRGHGTTSFVSSATFRNGQQAAFALDLVALMDALKIKKAILGGFDLGSDYVCTVAALWPERCAALVSVSGYLITDLKFWKDTPLPPQGEYAWWYQYYFSTHRGVIGYTKYRHDFAKLIWKNVSPKWDFSDATFDRTAAAFNNPDYIDVIINHYRWHIGLVDGEPKYADIEKRLAAAPVVTVPTITIASDFDGAAAEGTAYRDKFSGKYSHKIFKGIGHDVPQEAPGAFADAVMEVAHY